MASYHFSRVGFDASSVHIYCTDQSELTALITELKTVVATAREKATLSLPTGEQYFVHIDRLSGRDIDVGWWVMKQLCTNEYHRFRLSVQADDSLKLRQLLKKMSVLSPLP
jgi:hypothetical protein